jgi:AcrR family transcriptional regulator
MSPVTTGLGIEGGGMSEERAVPQSTDTTRARLADAAVRAFAERGFHATTTRDIAAAAGMSPAALYVHHRSKEELLFLISREGHETVRALVRDATSSTNDPVEAVRHLMRDFAVHHARDNVGARVINYELPALSPEHLTTILAIRHEIEQELRALIARGVEAGVFATPDVDLTTAALLSLGIDLARWYRSGRRWTPEQVGDQYADYALRVLGVGRTAARRVADAPPPRRGSHRPHAQ